MITVKEEDIDKITETFYLILKGKKTAPIELPENYADNEIKQMVDYINRFIEEHNSTTELIYTLSRGNLDFEAPKGSMLFLQSLKSLQASLKHLTWQTQQIAKGVFTHKIDFMGEFSAAFNSMSRQLEESFESLRNSEATARKRVEELAKTRRAMLNMMEDLREAKREAEEARMAAEEATRTKSDFLANMSHEIRTPMNAITGMTHLIRRTELNPKQQDYVRKISVATKTLLGIINDILDFSKIEAGKLSMESVDFDVYDVLDQLSTLISVKAQEKKLEFMFSIAPDVPTMLVGDSLRLGQVLTNLANNAVKFTEHGEIVVSIGLVEQRADSATLNFAVRDTGIGLTEEQKNRLFQPFSQADVSTTRKYGGSGLGLTICKRLVEMMGGNIEVKSEPNDGSTFTFTAVFGINRQVSRPQFPVQPELRAMRVLVVDDNLTSRHILKDILESFAVDVSLAASGAEGLKRLEDAVEENPFTLVILDCEMPDMDGFAVSQQIRRHPRLSPPPAMIMLSAYSRDDVRQQTEQAGIEAFLVKPVSPSHLFDAIMQACDQETAERNRMLPQQDANANMLESIRGAHILLVEDNEINQQVATELLENEGFRVTVANNGKEAVESICDLGSEILDLPESNVVYNVILMDIQMPQMDGYEATHRIRDFQSKISNQKSKIPIIAMTADAMQGTHAKCLEAGMDDYVSKPIEPEQLFSALLKWIPSGGQYSVFSEQYSGDSGQYSGGSEQYSGGSEQYSGDTVHWSLNTDYGPLNTDQYPGLECASGLKRVGGNWSLYIKLLKKFHASHANAPDEIRQAFMRDDTELAVRLAHTMKGVAGNIGANDLYTAARELETAIKEGAAEKFDLLIECFTASLHQVLVAIDHLERDEEIVAPSAPDASQQTASIDLAKVTAVLTQLDALLQDGDMEAVEQLELLKEYMQGSNMEQELREVEEYIEEYEFEEALNVLDNISKTMKEH